MSAPKMGAVVLYCGHDASFPADIFKIGGCNVVIANGDLDKAGILTRPASPDCTHHVSDVLGGVWKPARGIFAVPDDACQELPPGQVEEWYGPRRVKQAANLAPKRSVKGDRR